MLNDLLEDYKEANELEQQEIINEFLDMLWSSKYIFKTYKKQYMYEVNEELLNYREDLINLFNKYKIIEFTYCKSFYDKQLGSIDYIRIHINNMYGFLVNKNVYLPKEYYQLLLTPKKEYYSTINKIKNDELVNYNEIKNKIKIAILEAEQLKEIATSKKLDMSWQKFKELIDTYMVRLFNNYTPPHEYEEKHGWEMRVDVDGWNEDNYIVSYFCRSLTGYLRNYIRNKERIDKHCVNCDKKISNKNKSGYCSNCYKVYRRKYKTEKQRLYRQSQDVDS